MILAALALAATVFIPERVVVSDTNSFTCGSGPASEIAADGSRIFSSYLTSRTGYGEAHDIVALADIPIANPSAAENHVICRAGDTICGVKVDEVDSYDAFLFGGKMRCVIGVNGGLLGWRDWDPDTRRICGEGMFRCRTAPGGPAEALLPETLAKHLESKGFRGHDVSRTYRDRMIMHSHVCRADGALYGTLTSSLSQPVVFRCEDGSTLEFAGVVPALCEYECALAHVGGKFYALGRKMEGDNFFVSDDGAKTFRPCGRLPDGEQRPQLAEWNGKLLVAFSAPGEKPGRVREGRNNIHILLGSGPDLSTYREILHAVDPMGIVYFNIVPSGGDLHILWSDARRFPDKVIWGAVQGKDRILYGRIRPR